jgi:hypothetical protein
MADKPLTLVQAAFLEAVRPTPSGKPPRRPHDCLRAAVVVDGDRKVWYPCRSHEGDVHHYAAHWPACPAPFCRLPYSHYPEGTMHDIPPGKVEYHDAIGKEADRG